jgi:hypothetical protein
LIGASDSLSMHRRRSHACANTIDGIAIVGVSRIA